MYSSPHEIELKYPGRIVERIRRRFGPEISRIRYDLTKNALPFTVKTLKPLPTKAERTRRLVLFAHFDTQNLVDDYVRFYLERLYEAGSAIVFVSGSPGLSAAAVAPIEHLCAAIYTRKTLSLDFGSWHLAWQHLKAAGWRLEDFDQFVLANDSVYGPLFDLEEMFSTFQDADMCGVTESLEFAPHLQSYFLLWNLNPRTRQFLEDFWKNFRYITDKDKLVQACEIGLSVSTREQGLTQKAYVSDADLRRRVAARPEHEFAVRAREGVATNNTLFYWDVLIAEMRCPFLKAALLKQNPAQMERLGSLPDVIAQHTSYDFALIANHLRRMGRPVPGGDRQDATS